MQFAQHQALENAPFNDHFPADFGEPPPPRLLAFLTAKQWIVGLLLSSLAIVPVYSYCTPFSGWVVAALFLTFLMLFHFVASLGKLIPIPHIAIFTAAISYVIAPLASFYNPPSNRTYIIEQPATYFEYACPAFCMVVLGWMTPYLWSRRPLLIPSSSNSKETVANESTLLILFWFGLALTLIRFLAPLPGSIAFFVTLLSHLRYVSCGAWVAAGRRDRAVLVIGVLLLEFLQSIYSSMFHEFFLWAACIFCLWVGSRAPSRLFATTILLLGVALLFPLQQAKTQYRLALRNSIGAGDSQTGSLGITSIGDRVDLFKKQLVDTVSENGDRAATGRSLGDDFVRFNQGWLVARVLSYVPNMEPLAEGQTIKTALISAALPRFIYSGKFETGGREFLRRFTGIYLGDNTSMNIGYIGELYANFGLSAGIFGCFIYALILSLSFRWVSLLSSTRSQLAGLVSFFCFRMPVAESDLTDVFNYLAKALIVIGLLRLFFPILFQVTTPSEDTVAG